ncbi:MAG: UTP--glucose-1-phosphate uridylyltransferase AglF [Methanomassiliicoccales archaeon PtaB.Bin215]|nr:MAG: UTP--glucose-1-phosphate uridylyltransferase AglF [Methanomassiliicoccales archaeon PtaB.Bin215]
MKAVILAAGEGTRLRPFTVSRPKVMIPIGNRPILEYVVRALAANGITEIILVVGYMKERIMSFFGNGSRFGVKISYAIQEKQLGTAHAALAVRNQIKEEFIMVAGDNIIDAQVISDLLKHKGGLAMLVTDSEMPSKYGVVQIESGRVVDIIEKPDKKVGNIINTGIYRLPPSIFDHLEKGVMAGKSGITHVLHSCMPRLKIEAVRSTGRWMDAVYPWDLIRLNEYAFSLSGQETAGLLHRGTSVHRRRVRDRSVRDDIPGHQHREWGAYRSLHVCQQLHDHEQRVHRLARPHIQGGDRRRMPHHDRLLRPLRPGPGQGG